MLGWTREDLIISERRRCGGTRVTPLTSFSSIDVGSRSSPPIILATYLVPSQKQPSPSNTVSRVRLVQGDHHDLPANDARGSPLSPHIERVRRLTLRPYAFFAMAACTITLTGHISKPAAGEPPSDDSLLDSLLESGPRAAGRVADPKDIVYMLDFDDNQWSFIRDNLCRER